MGTLIKSALALTLTLFVLIDVHHQHVSTISALLIGAGSYVGVAITDAVLDRVF